jgi:hypothetical protein
MFSGVNNFILGLFTVEVFSWLFSIYLNENRFKYLTIQRIFLLVRVVGVLTFPLVLILSIALKLGLPPFHSWMLRIRTLIKKYVFLFITTIHKLFPLFLFIKAIAWSISLFLVIFIIIIRGVIILQFKRLYFVVIVSSLVHSSWLLLRNIIKIRLIMVYWLFYSIIIFIIIYSLFLRSLALRDESQSKYSRLVWLILRGLPPFTIFWLKINVILLILRIRWVIRITLILVPIIVLTSYYRVFHLSLSLSVLTKAKLLPILFYVIIVLYI